MRPWIDTVAAAAVTFADGVAEEFDGIVFGTGFDLHLPFLDEDIREILDLDAVHLDADRYTFHPDLPGLAFVGMWEQSGGYFVPLELQARWIAYTWGGAIPATSETVPAGSHRCVSLAARDVTENPDEPGGCGLRTSGRCRAQSRPLAAPAPGLAVRPPRAELLPDRGPGCASRRPGPVRPRRRCIQRNRIE